MLALLDAYDRAAQQLLRSLQTARIPVTPVVVRYDGDLPEGALSPIAHYAGLPATGDPLFFDEVPVPAWCEIRQGREPFGEILRDGARIGRIGYTPGSFREVQSVDWLHPDGTVAQTDHYDRHGSHYATTHVSRGVAYQTVYRGPGEWEVEVSHTTRAVLLRSADRQLAFSRMADLVSHYLDEQGLSEEPALIDSLSHPLFVMRRRALSPRTTLFWQEAIRGELPANMVTELERPRALERIVFFDEDQRQRVAQRHPDTGVELVRLSHLGQFAEKRAFDARRVFTLTSTDVLPALPALLAAFPELTFVVAALTLMSDRLHALARAHANLTLLPSATHNRIREELEGASVYLDIDAGVHLLDVVPIAYHLSLVVLADARHAKSPEHALVTGTEEELVARLAAVTSSPAGRARALDELHTLRGSLSTAADWRRVLAMPEWAETDG